MATCSSVVWVCVTVEVQKNAELFKLEYKALLCSSFQKADSYLEWAAGWLCGNKFPLTLLCWSTCLWHSFIRFQTDPVVGVTVNCVTFVELHSCPISRLCHWPNLNFVKTRKSPSKFSNVLWRVFNFTPVVTDADQLLFANAHTFLIRVLLVF